MQASERSLGAAATVSESAVIGQESSSASGSAAVLPPPTVQPVIQDGATIIPDSSIFLDASLIATRGVHREGMLWWKQHEAKQKYGTNP